MNDGEREKRGRIFIEIMRIFGRNMCCFLLFLVIIPGILVEPGPHQLVEHLIKSSRFIPTRTHKSVLTSHPSPLDLIHYVCSGKLGVSNFVLSCNSIGKGESETPTSQIIDYNKTMLLKIYGTVPWVP